MKAIAIGVELAESEPLLCVACKEFSKDCKDIGKIIKLLLPCAAQLPMEAEVASAEGCSDEAIPCKQITEITEFSSNLHNLQ